MSTRQSRRLFLAGAGVTLALPFLPSALWSRRTGAATCKPPRRFMAWFAPNGINMPDWTPTTAGATWDLTPITTPLDPIRKKIVILTGLDNQDVAVPGSPPDDSTAGTGCFLNMIPVNGHETDPARISIDQALLPVLNGPDCAAPLLPSLQIGIQGDNGSCSTAPCEFSRTLSWNQGVSLPNIWDPQICFDRMFASGDPAVSAAAERAARRKSILDSVLVQTKSLSFTLSPADRAKLDQHTTFIRNLETRLQRLGKTDMTAGGTPNGATCTPPVRPDASPPLNFDRGITPPEILQGHMALYLDLMAVAFQCDITRAITFMIGNARSNNDYSFLFGVTAAHHAVSQHAGAASKLAMLTRIDTWEVLQAATLLRRLDGMLESDGQSVLDHTTFYMSSDFADGQIHNHWDMPVLLAGGASGGLKIDGRHINYTPQIAFPRPLVGLRSNVQAGRVFISMLHAHGIMQDAFGMAKGGPLPELMP